MSRPDRGIHSNTVADEGIWSGLFILYLNYVIYLKYGYEEKGQQEKRNA